MWPAASELAPTTWAFSATALAAVSAGVANSGPTSTEKPKSPKPEAITFWPRSWPSWPILATRMVGARPSASRKAATIIFARETGPDAPASAE